MASEPVHCPYCNASMLLSPDEEAAPRVPCPRCGDSFPNPRYREGAVNGRSPAAGGPPAPAEAERLSNSGIARVILGIMVCMAIIGGTYAIMTVQFRRNNDVKGLPTPPKGDITPVQAVAPADLAALGYLPQDCRILAGFHVAELVGTAEGRDLLEALKASGSDVGLGRLAEWTGLTYRDIDHVVAGVELPDQGMPEFTIVMRTRQAYSFQVIAKGADQTAATYKGRPAFQTIFKVGSGGLRLYPVVWCVDAKTIVIRLPFLQPKLEEELDGIPSTPGEPLAGVDGDIRRLIETRMNLETFLWAAGDVERVRPLLALAQMAPPSAGVQKTLAFAQQLDRFAASVRLQKGVTLDATLQTKDVAAARSLTKSLEKLEPEGVTTWNVIGPEEAGADLPENREVQLQARVPVGKLAEVLGGQ